ncbi:DUF3313 domain-containing protein [Roseateles puraquae]|uniref:DUF3313 domain-containing protein n=1 Tax=Roseateles puraquae TaxID=431059 RepID=A0A254N9U2_9BURK|nr:DUF3313 domain-containing protein [Roseateles puraquae]MDG0853934.1 DUF3313 domain-containing protein [Roseateles puraquae]OWR04765.1 hypothetical protein CDO81_09320 [Roseateles puraquae]
MKSTRLLQACLALALTGLAACSTPQPHRYEEIASSSQLRQNNDERRDRIPYSVDRAVSWASYANLILDPVIVYGGRDSQFEDVSQEERQELAEYMFQRFSQQLDQRFGRVGRVQPGTLRIRLSLTGAKPNTAVVSTVTRFDLVGAPYNAVQGIRGKEGAFIGSVMYSVEIYDASSGELLKAFVAKQFPNAMNVAATFGRLKAARVGIDKGAEELLTMLK